MIDSLLWVEKYRPKTIDEFSDASGVDAGASTNETLTSGVYHGTATVTPSVTEDADVGPSSDGDYTYYVWTGTGAGSYVNNTTQDHEWLVVGGGGGGGHGNGGGGGPGNNSGGVNGTANTGGGGGGRTSSGGSGLVIIRYLV